MTSKPQQLVRCIDEIDTHVCELGWDRPPLLFALVNSSDLLGQVDFDSEAETELRNSVAAHPDHLSALVQDTSAFSDLTEIANRVWFGDEVSGVAVCVERLALPPQYVADLPADPAEQANWVLNHPHHQEIRVIAGRLRSGEVWCRLRGREFSDRDEYIDGADLAPELTQMLAAMLIESPTDFSS